MVAQATHLNPESTFVHGDMQTFRLGRTFDAVLMDDAVSRMSCLADFEAAFRTASAHLKPGGVLVATPDVTTETFRQGRTIPTPATRTGTRDGLDVVFVENVYDSDPAPAGRAQPLQCRRPVLQRTVDDTNGRMEGTGGSGR